MIVALAGAKPMVGCSHVERQPIVWPSLAKTLLQVFDVLVSGVLIFNSNLFSSSLTIDFF